MTRFSVGEICQTELTSKHGGGFADVELLRYRAEDNTWLVDCPSIPYDGPPWHEGWWAHDRYLRKLPRDGDENCDFHEFICDLKLMAKSRIPVEVD